VAAVGLMASSALVEAAVYSNLGASDANDIVNDDAWTGQAFTTGSSDTRITDISLSLRNPSVTGGSIDVLIYTSVGSSPNSVLTTAGTLSAASIGSSSATYTLQNLTIDVSPNTQYFVVLHGNTIAPAGDYIVWQASTTAFGLGAVGINPLRTVESSTGNLDWASAPDPAMYQQMSITAVPEPATTAAAVSGLLAAFAMLRRPSVRAKLGALIGR
jgi:hypothetical protein